MTRRYHHTSGFAMVTAIVVMGLVAITLTATGVVMVGEARRTSLAGDDAQLRQLLLAGADFAVAHVQSSADGQFAVSLPDSLQQQSAALIVTIRSGASASEKDAEIEASLPRHKVSQHIRLSLQDGNWRIIEANFGA